MGLQEFLYSVGEKAEASLASCVEFVRDSLRPSPAKEPPTFKVTRRFVKRDVTVHELLSLYLQMTFIAYLFLNLIAILLRLEWYWLLVIYTLYFLHLRKTIVRNWEFFVDPDPYRFFYYAISLISFLSFLGYLLVRQTIGSIQAYSAYLVGVIAALSLFRHYFKSRYGRDYTYGIVEEINENAVRVFVHDDIAANVKPGLYWLEPVPELESGRIVKILLEEKAFRSSVPKKIIEVYLEEPESQSSKSFTEPKKETE